MKLLWTCPWFVMKGPRSWPITTKFPLVIIVTCFFFFLGKELRPPWLWDKLHIKDQGFFVKRRQSLFVFLVKENKACWLVVMKRIKSPNLTKRAKPAWWWQNEPLVMKRMARAANHYKKDNPSTHLLLFSVFFFPCGASTQIISCSYVVNVPR